MAVMSKHQIVVTSILWRFRDLYEQLSETDATVRGDVSDAFNSILIFDDTISSEVLDTMRKFIDHTLGFFDEKEEKTPVKQIQDLLREYHAKRGEGMKPYIPHSLNDGYYVIQVVRRAIDDSELLLFKEVDGKVTDITQIATVMGPSDRRHYLPILLGITSVNKIAEMFGVSIATIKKDIRTLD